MHSVRKGETGRKIFLKRFQDSGEHESGKSRLLSTARLASLGDNSQSTDRLTYPCIHELLHGVAADSRGASAALQLKRPQSVEVFKANEVHF
jgi:hypothetical protein